MKRIILILIILLAFILRFYHLDSYPALNADEAAIGYNAYSLIQTGKDEHGNAWPIHFQSFNDYKPGLYFYVVVPFVKLFGLTELSVRAPAAFLGVMTVLLVYLLVKELFKDKEGALVASFFLAISPWHIHFSRGGWEVNVATFFITLGVFLFLKGLKRPKYYYFSLISFVLALYTYHAARVIVPLLGVGLFAIYFKDILKNKKTIIIAFVVGLVIVLPLGYDLTKGGALSRAAGVGLFADPGPRARLEEQRGEHININSLLAKALHNKGVNYSLAFLENWGKHYWGEFLFLSGDDVQRNKVPETGQMYLYDIILVGIGLVVIVRNSRSENGRLAVWKREHAVVIWWLLIAPVASALTFQAPGALRAHNMVIPLVILSEFGLMCIVAQVRKRVRVQGVRNAFYVFVVAVICLNFARYLHMYYVHMAKEYPFSSQYGLKDLVSYVQGQESAYQKVLVTDRYDQPYILFLFYMKYPPAKFQQEHALTPRDGFGFSTVNHFDKHFFSTIRFDEAKVDNPNTLIVGTDAEIPNAANIVRVINGPNGKPVFKIVAN